MNSLLRVDASARLEGSHSRSLGDFFVQQALRSYPAMAVVNRDLQRFPVPHITEDTITGFYTPEGEQTEGHREATALSDLLISEVQAADTLLITTPMYNFSVPASFKAWIDQIVRIGRTFSYSDGEFGGLLNVQEAYVCCAYGATGYLEGGDFHSANFLEPYLEFLLRFLGIPTIKFVSAEMLTGDAAAIDSSLAAARRTIEGYLGRASL